MQSHKEKVRLTENEETLLIPLYSKAVENRQPNPILVDRKAQEILEKVEYDFDKLNVPRKTAVTLCIRAKRFDFYTRNFLAGHLESVVIHLGCGLDARCERASGGEAEWYDLDLPDVIDLRRAFYEETAKYHMISSSAADLRWIDDIAAHGRPVLVVAEGLFMYLTEDEIKALILNLKRAFPGCDLVFDAYSILTAKHANKHPSIQKTGAVIKWGIDNAASMEQWADGIRLKEEWYFTQAEDIEKLGPGYRIAFWIAGLFRIAKTAHRILYFGL